MCRSIKTLRRPGETPSEDEFHAAALQYIRKICGYRKPSRANEEVFNRAVVQIAESSRTLLENLVLNR
jgi:hypothetical protein